jgi:ribosome-binding protein aMBF1 (putative translation factor)
VLTIVCCLYCILLLALLNILIMQDKSILNLFGERIRELRKAKGISQEELADKASLHRTYIGMIERGEKNISIINIEKIAKSLDIQLNTLFNGL